MLNWLEGEVLEVIEPLPGEEQVYRFSVRELSKGFQIDDVQMHIKDSFMELPQEGSIIAFYQDSAATSKFGFLLSDPRPTASPIAIETAVKAAKDGELVFQKGEIAFGALGNKDNLFFPVKGARLWLRNTGDGVLFSGSYQQRVVVSDSSDSVDIEGTNVDIYTHGNFLTTHAIHIDSNTLGVTSMTLGLKNPTTGLFLSHLNSDTLGGWSLGIPEPTGIINDVLSGFTYNPLNLLPPGPICKITASAEPLAGTATSQISVHTLGTTINGVTISIDGPKALLGASIPATLLKTSSLTTTINSLKSPGAINIFGLATKLTSTVLTSVGSPIITLGGITPLAPSLISISGLTTVSGIIPMTPCFGIGSVTVPVGPETPAPGILAALGVKQIPIFVNGVPRLMLII